MTSLQFHLGKYSQQNDLSYFQPKGYLESSKTKDGENCQKNILDEIIISRI